MVCQGLLTGVSKKADYQCELLVGFLFWSRYRPYLMSTRPSWCYPTAGDWKTR